MMMPPSTAPPIESSPPRIAAGNTLMPYADRPDDTPLTTATTQPATAETVAEIAQAIANTVLTEMPSDCATCWLKAVARIASPYFEVRKNHAIPIIIASETTRLITYTVWICRPKKSRDWLVKTRGNGWGLTPKIHF